MNQVLIEDITELITHLYNTYNSEYSLEQLLEKYLPNISIEKKSEISEKNIKKNKLKKNKQHSIAPDENRCIARCWGGEESVKYNPITEEWTYGVRCKRFKSKDKFCLTHYKQFISNNGLTHGIYNREPNYIKYKIIKNKIEKRFKIDC